MEVLTNAMFHPNNCLSSRYYLGILLLYQLLYRDCIYFPTIGKMNREFTINSLWYYMSVRAGELKLVRRFYECGIWAGEAKCKDKGEISTYVVQVSHLVVINILLKYNDYLFIPSYKTSLRIL